MFLRLYDHRFKVEISPIGGPPGGVAKSEFGYYGAPVRRFSTTSAISARIYRRFLILMTPMSLACHFRVFPAHPAIRDRFFVDLRQKFRGAPGERGRIPGKSGHFFARRPKFFARGAR